MPCDYRRYPPDWKQRRERILERAGNRCEDCGAENGTYGYREAGRFVAVTMEPTQELDALTLDGYKTIRIVLTIAHLDHDEDNWEVADDRLRALCQKCHLALDNHRHVNHAVLTRDSNRGQLRLDVEDSETQRRSV